MRKKEGVGCIYQPTQRVLGYTSWFAYIDAELRQHSQKGTLEAISCSCRRDAFVARGDQLLWRIDGGCDAADISRWDRARLPTPGCRRTRAASERMSNGCQARRLRRIADSCPYPDNRH